MTTKRGLHPILALVFGVFPVAVGLVLLSLMTQIGAPLIAYNGNTMTVYADVLKASDGREYRVTATTHFEPGKKPTRIMDMYSLDAKYANIAAISEGDLISWRNLYVCSRDQMRMTPVSCSPDSGETTKLINEVVRKTMVKRNAIGNFEIYWAWEMETKNFINQINSR